MVQTGYCSVAFGKTNISRGSPNTTTRQHACAGWVDRLFEGAVRQFGSLTSTQRSARNANRFGRCGVAAVRRCGGAELARELTAGTRLSPPSRKNTRAALFRLRTAAQTGLRRVLAICGRRGRVGCIGLSGHDPHPSRVSLEAGRINRMATRHVERVVVVGANARSYEQRMDRRMRRTKIRQGDALEVPSERRITIRTTTALTNTSLKGFCICSSCRRCGCRYKVTNRHPTR